MINYGRTISRQSLHHQSRQHQRLHHHRSHYRQTKRLQDASNHTIIFAIKGKSPMVKRR